MKQLQNSRAWMVGGAVTAALIVAIGWFMFISPKLSSTTSLHSQAATTLQQNTVLQQKVRSLQVKSSHLSRYVAELRSALLALPVDSGLPAFTRQLSAQAHLNGISVNSVVVGGVSAIVPAAAAVPVTTSSSPAPTPSATSTVPAGTTPTVAGGLMSVQVTVLSQGTLGHQLAFLDDIRTAGSRRALITSAQVAPGTGAKTPSIDGASSFTTNLTIFSQPQTPEQIVQLKKLLSGNVGN